MADVSALTVPTNLLKGVDQTSAADLAKRADIKKTAEAFEASFLSVMLGEMFQGVETAAPFGGGQGEKMFQSFMNDAFAKHMAKHGGIGVADAVTREMLKLQGLSQE